MSVLVVMVRVVRVEVVLVMVVVVMVMVLVVVDVVDDEEVAVVDVDVLQGVCLTAHARHLLLDSAGALLRLLRTVQVTIRCSQRGPRYACVRALM